MNELLFSFAVVWCTATQHARCVNADKCGVYQHHTCHFDDRVGVRDNERWRQREANDLAQRCKAGDIVAVGRRPILE